jgi:hypothetical protein
MAYLTFVGYVPENLTGLGARGYHVYRRGKKVRVVWGPVTTVRTQTVGFIWERTTQHKIHRCRTVREAVALRNRLVEDQEDQGYTRLPPGTRIQRPYRILSTLNPGKGARR